MAVTLPRRHGAGVISSERGGCMGLADSFDDPRAARGGSLTARMALCCVGVELPYAFLIAATFLRVIAIQRPADLEAAIGLIAVVHVVKASTLVALCVKFSRPIERWRSTGTGDPEL